MQRQIRRIRCAWTLVAPSVIGLAFGARTNRAAAQATTATLLGTVTDSSGAVVTHAKVTLTERCLRHNRIALKFEHDPAKRESDFFLVCIRSLWPHADGQPERTIRSPLHSPDFRPFRSTRRHRDLCRLYMRNYLRFSDGSSQTKFGDQLLESCIIVKTVVQRISF